MSHQAACTPAAAVCTRVPGVLVAYAGAFVVVFMVAFMAAPHAAVAAAAAQDAAAVAQAPSGVVSSDDIARALEAKPQPPGARSKTRGLTLRARTDARDAQTAAAAPDGNSGADAANTAGAIGAAPAHAPAIDLNIPFELDSAALRADAMAQLSQLEAALKQDALERARFRITGHTDASGSVEHNRFLSFRRAEAVRRFLMERGVAGTRLETAGAGSDQLLKPEAPRDGANRRVEIRNLGVAP